MTHRKDILQTAIDLTTGDRNEAYGEPWDNMLIYASLLSVLFEKEVTPAQAAETMVMAKQARILGDFKRGVYKEDSHVDRCAYSAIVGECQSHGTREVSPFINGHDAEKEAPIQSETSGFPYYDFLRHEDIEDEEEEEQSE